MADTSLPSGYGGLMRFNAEYPSKFMISPKGVIGFIIGVVAFVLLLKVVFPIG